MQTRVPADSTTKDIYKTLISVAQQIMKDARKRTTDYLKAEYGKFEAGTERISEGTYYLTFTTDTQQQTIAFDMRNKRIIQEVS